MTVKGKISFRINIDEVPIDFFDEVISGIDAKIEEWNTQYPQLEFSRNDFNISEKIEPE